VNVVVRASGGDYVPRRAHDDRSVGDKIAVYQSLSAQIHFCDPLAARRTQLSPKLSASSASFISLPLLRSLVLCFSLVFYSFQQVFDIILFCSNVLTPHISSAFYHVN